jgi:hypothetical protein
MECKLTKKKCIFCGKTEEKFDKNNCWTEEHIIPQALGNETLKISNVCKECNSGLGTYVDNYFVNHMLIKLIRQQLGLKGQSGKIPNAFKEGKDNGGHLIRVDENYQPTIVPYIEKSDTHVKIVASSTVEARMMVEKTLSRMKLPKNEIQDVLDKVNNIEFECFQPMVQYDCTIELNRFYLEAIKIAFEYAVYKLGDDYLKDSRAIEIQRLLKGAIDGKMKTECKNVPGVCLIHKKLGRILETAKDLNCHMIMIHPDAENKLIAVVILFMESWLSFSVLISEDASKFSVTNSSLTEFIDVKINSNFNMK